MAYKSYPKKKFYISLMFTVLALVASILVSMVKIKSINKDVVNNIEYSATYLLDRVEEAVIEKYEGKSKINMATMSRYLLPTNMKKLILKEETKANARSLGSVAIWKKDESGKIINVAHSMPKLKKKDIYGFFEGEKLTNENARQYKNLKTNNQWLEDNFDTIKESKIEDISSILQNKKRDYFHAVKRIKIVKKDSTVEEFVLDIQYNKKAIIDHRITKTIQSMIIVVIFMFLLSLLIYSLVFDSNMLMHVIILYALIFTIYPITWMISLTFSKTNAAGSTNLNPIPTNPSLDNYKAAIFNSTRVKEEGIVLENNRLFITKEINRVGLEFNTAKGADKTLKNKNNLIKEIDLSSIVTKNSEIYKEVEALKPSFDMQEERAFTSDTEMKEFSDDFKALKIKSDAIAKNYKKLAKQIIKTDINIAESSTKLDKIAVLKRKKEIKSELMDLSEFYIELSKEFSNLGEGIRRKIVGKDLVKVYNVFDSDEKNILKADEVEFLPVRKIIESKFMGETKQIKENHYYIEFIKTPEIEVGHQVYSVEYFTYLNRLFVSGLTNSIFIAIATSIIGMTLSSAAAYAFSRFRFPGRDGLMMSFLVTQMFPGTMMIIPLYIIFSSLGLIDTFKGLIIAYSITALPFNIWNLKGFFDTIPVDLEEAALIDGCSASQTFYKIVLPLSLPALAISALFSFMNAWNEYIIAATFMNGEERYTIPVVIKMLVSGNDIKLPMFATMAVLVSIPVVIVFIKAQKYIVGGLTAGGVKG